MKRDYHCPVPFDPDNPCCAILQSISEGVFTIDLEKKITYMNRAAEFMTGFASAEAIGQHCFDIFRSNVCQVNCPLEQAMATGRSIYERPAVIINKAGIQIPIGLTADLLRDDHGNLVGAVEVFRDLTAIEDLRKSLSNRHRLGDMVSKSRRMQEIFDILPDVAESESTVLIQGPSGSGKEVLANTIHELSPRKGKPLVKINCAAIPDTLLESELFGYVKGAFTDARKDKQGRFALADKGTLFLDEIGDTSPAMQAKLLRVLEEKQFVPLGAAKPVTVDVRVIAASNRDLKLLVEQGKFRDDLYYRINIIRIDLPSLYERREDIPLLVEHLISRMNAVKGKDVSGVSDEVMRLLMNYRFPGNVRELENILEHAYVLCRGRIIETRHLPMEFLNGAKGYGAISSKLTALECREAETIQQVLQKHRGNKALTARELGIGRATLWRKLRKFNLR
ncbi:MAG: sigma 54-interacting transcriptional regulator [candidate division WOR-3 bacterium]